MNDASRSLSASEYERHASFVKRLARRLAVDEARAEDLAQDVWVAALEKPPRGSGEPARLRAWFRRVLRNKAALELRRSGRRERREMDAARSESGTDTTELIERMELHRHVVDAVLALPEDYRAVLVRRYSEGEAPAEIARRLDLPEPTVRTRLRRGLERLRARLKPKLGETPALFLTSLGRLTGDVSRAAPHAPSLPVTTEPLVLLTMKKVVAVTVIALAAVWVVWTVGLEPASEPELPAAREVAARAPAELEPAVVPEEKTVTAGPAAERVAVADAAGSSDPDTDAVAAPGVKPDRNALGGIVLHVLDPFGNPVDQALVTMTMLRTVESPGSSRSWHGAPETATSGPDGIARVGYPEWIDDYTAGWQEVHSVGFRVTHPDFITYEEWGYEVAEEEGTVVLERGAFVIVSGWIDDPSENVLDVEPRLTFEVDVKPDDWIPVRDGRPSCSRIPPGLHALYLHHETVDGTTYFSAVAPFELAEGEQKELHLQLVPPLSMVGVVEDRVPRPIVDGEVDLNLYVGQRRTKDDSEPAVMLRKFQTKIEPDGTFRFTGLPPGGGELIAMCDGWSSKRVRLADEQWTVDEDGEKQWHQMWGLQHLDPARHADDPYVLAMEPTGSVEFTVLGPDGEPLPDSSIQMWPNVSWQIGYSSIFLERRWMAMTDAEGVATIANLPAEESIHFGVYTPKRHLMPLHVDRWDRETRNAWVDVEPGAEVRHTIRMEPPEE